MHRHTLVLALLLASCTPTTEEVPEEPLPAAPGACFTGRRVTDVYVEQGAGKADVLWIVDGSPALAPTRDALHDAVLEGLDQVYIDGVDVQFGVLSATPEDEADLGRLVQTDSGPWTGRQTVLPIQDAQARINQTGAPQGSLRPLDALSALLNPDAATAAHNAGFPREGVPLHVLLVVSDDAGLGATAEELAIDLEGWAEDAGVTVQIDLLGHRGRTACTLDEGDLSPTPVYAALAELTGGGAWSACDGEELVAVQQTMDLALERREEIIARLTACPNTLEVWVEDGDYVFHGLPDFTDASCHDVGGTNCFPFTWSQSLNAVVPDSYHPSPGARWYLRYEPFVVR